MTTLQVNIHAAKSRLSELLREVEAGTDVIVARAGQPVAKIIPWPPAPPERKIGFWDGQIHIYEDDIVGSDPEILAMFEKSAEEDLF
ncbi:type II toxin-antitoxin system Phd/YefM family antitoxin [Candidatus Poriferisocius sp.]|uniref:type II toxin-antitoxin system Phd/YefM family antitoxin n=1 Tax=Candidatus Poriferisocius sp. TaxID=3101276 RepID=UPI003B5AF19A